jgi:hypothetical protein
MQLLIVQLPPCKYDTVTTNRTANAEHKEAISHFRLVMRNEHTYGSSQA